MSQDTSFPDDERDKFVTAITSLRRLYPAFCRLKEDLGLEHVMGFKQMSVIDFSEIYRFLHPEYVKLDRNKNLLIVHLMFQEFLDTELRLITPYYYELINHLNLVAESMDSSFLEDLRKDPEVGEFMVLMSAQSLTTEERARLARLMDIVQEKVISCFADLISPKIREKVIVEPINNLIRLINEKRITFWKDPPIPSSSLLDSQVFLDVVSTLNDVRSDRPISNRVDALAAAFVHEANKTLMSEKKYVVIVTGSPIPLLIYRYHPIKHQYLRFPMERDLNYVASRIYFFKKYKEKAHIIERLDRILPLASEVLEVGDSILDRLQRTGSIKQLPYEILFKMRRISDARKTVDELLVDMSAVLESIAKDVSVLIETRTADFRATLFGEICTALKSDTSWSKETYDTVKAIEDVFDKLSSNVGKVTTQEKIAIEGRFFERDLNDAFCRLLQSTGYQVKMSDLVLNQAASLPLIPDFVAQKANEVFVIEVKTITGERKIRWIEEGSKIKTTADILRASRVFGDSVVIPMLILANAKLDESHKAFSQITGVRILAWSESEIEKLQKARTEDDLKGIAPELLGQKEKS